VAAGAKISIIQICLYFSRNLDNCCMSLPPLSRLGAAALYPAQRLPLVTARDRIERSRYQFVLRHLPGGGAMQVATMKHVNNLLWSVAAVAPVVPLRVSS